MATPTTAGKKEEKCMDFSVKMFRVVGCWPNWKQKHKRSERLYFCYTTTTYAVLFVYTLILVYGLTVHYSAWASLEEAIEDLIVFATGFIVLLKITLFLLNQTRLQNMIDYINNDLNKREVKDEEDNAVIKSCIKHERSLTKTYIFFGYCITVLYTTSSIVRILRERSPTGDSYTLPLKYPFHPDKFPMYHILYLHQMMVMILNGHIGTLSDSFFSCLTYYLCGHFQIIKNRIAKEGGVITRNFVSYHKEMISMDKLPMLLFLLVGFWTKTAHTCGSPVSCCRNSGKATNSTKTKLTENLESIFGLFLMFQLISNSLLICLGLLQITQTANIKLLHYMKCLIYVTIKLSQMFLYCWYGEEIKKKSSSVCTAAYSGLWHEARDKQIPTNIKIVMMRAQKCVKIKAGSYFVLSLPTLARVMNTAYGFFTMIKSTQKNES